MAASAHDFLEFIQKLPCMVSAILLTVKFENIFSSTVWSHVYDRTGSE